MILSYSLLILDTIGPPQRHLFTNIGIISVDRKNSLVFYSWWLTCTIHLPDIYSGIVSTEILSVVKVDTLDQMQEKSSVLTIIVKQLILEEEQKGLRPVMENY